MTKPAYDYLRSPGTLADERISFDYLLQLKETLELFPHKAFHRILGLMLEAYHNQRQVFAMGNGGSGSTASHLACDLNKGVSHGLEKKFRVICLNDNVPTMLAYANDLDYSDVFTEQLKNFFRPLDMVFGISGSGNSENVVKAILYARKNGGTTVGICGCGGGRLAEAADVSLVVRSEDMQKIEDVHMIVVHMLMQSLSAMLGPYG